jgi:hypothetical protein
VFISHQIKSCVIPITLFKDFIFKKKLFKKLNITIFNVLILHIFLKKFKKEGYFLSFTLRISKTLFQNLVG